MSERSPPESRAMFSSFFPGGWAKTSIPDSRGASGFSRRSSARPPPNRRRKTVWKFFLILLYVSRKSSVDSVRISDGDLLQVLPRAREVAELAGEEVEPVLHLGELLGRHQVDLAELAHLLAQLRQPGPQVLVGLRGPGSASRTRRGPARNAPVKLACRSLISVRISVTSICIFSISDCDFASSSVLLLQLLFLGAQLLVAAGDLPFQAGERGAGRLLLLLDLAAAPSPRPRFSPAFPSRGRASR